MHESLSPTPAENTVLSREALIKKHEQLVHAATIKAQQEREQERLTHLESLIPKRYQGVRFEDFHVTCEAQRQVVQVLKRFVATYRKRLAEGTNLFFLGRPGTGKTLLAYALYRELIAFRVDVLLTSWSTLLLNIRESQHRFSETRLPEVMQRLTRPQLLILDEVAAIEQGLHWLTFQEKQVLFEMLNRRYEALLSTLVITNADKAALTTLLGANVLDRLNHHSITLAFDWTSYRSGTMQQTLATNLEEKTGC